MHASSNGHEAAMKVLLQEGADHTVQDQVSDGVSECSCVSSDDDDVYVCVCVCVVGECGTSSVAP